MTTEELLKKRRKVISPYPEMERHNIKVGDIITISESAMYADKTQDGNPVVAIDHEIFPAIFKEIAWWEKRDVSDMPEYVKIDEKILPIKKWVIDIQGVWMNLHYPEPSYTLGNPYYPPVYPATKARSN